jgi:AraC-like DNA-binding protein/quercetin dioxygenase-like cupin family protein
MYERRMKNSPSDSEIPRVNIANYQLAAKPFEVWGPRTIPDTELIFIHSGTFALTLNRQTVRAEKNDLLVIFPGERHSFQCLEKSGIISCIHCDLPKPDGLTLPRIRKIHDHDLPDGFRRCADVFIHPAPWREELLTAILTEIWLRLRSYGSPTESVRPSERVEKMAAYIREHLDESVTRSTLAKRFHLSAQHVNYLFKNELSTTPTELLHRERVKMAFLLIQNERVSVKEAAYRTGFCDAYHFSKVFKKTYGFPPGRISRFFKPQ